MNILRKIPCDKRLHALIGVALIVAVTFFTQDYRMVLPALIIFAWGIEFYQKFTHSGTYDNLDAIAVIIGGLIVYIPILIKANLN